MSRQRVRAVGQFAWLNADLGVECLRCGLITVYCDFEALDRFTERGWSPAVADAVKRFRCRCGSIDVRLEPIPIFKRPKPVPIRPLALRPIYREDRRSLLYRGPTQFAEAAVVDDALDEVRTAIAECASGQVADLGPSVVVLRPYLYRGQDLDELVAALQSGRDPLLGMRAARHAFNVILRQLGQPTE